MTCAVVIQARMGSTRLPGKTLEPLGDATVLDWVVERCNESERADLVVVATSTNAEDDAIAEHLDQRGDATVVRGSADDVLARYIAAAAAVDADQLVRVTADCPFVEPELIDVAVEIASEVDYVATGLDGRFPRGLDLEVVRRAALETAHAEAEDPTEREHVTPFIVRRPERFRCAPLPAPPWARRPDVRLTLDEPADLVLLATVVAEMGATPASLRTEEVIAFLDQRPEIAAINRHVEHRTVT